MYKLTYVFDRIDSTEVKRYVCLENLDTKKFCVQSCDYIQIPLDTKKMYDLDYIFFDLFADRVIEENNNFFDSLKEVIAAFDSYFSD